MWLLDTWNVAGATEELNFKLSFLKINSHLNSHLWHMVTIMVRADLEYGDDFITGQFRLCYRHKEP